MNKLSISIIIPTYNEKENISKILEKLEKVLKAIAYEIIFVDDNSPDGTSKEVKSFMEKSSKIRLIHRIGRRGLSGAVIEGIFAANSELVAVMDCDLQHDETKLSDMMALFSKNISLDLVIGSRFTERGEISHKAFSKIREMGSKITTLLVKRLLSINSSDPLSGFFMVKKETFLRSADNLQTQGFKILADFLATSGRNIEIKEIGYKFTNRVAGESKMSFLTVLELIGLVFSQILQGRVSIRFILFCMVGLSGIFVQLLITGVSMFLINQFPTSQTLGIIAAMTSNYFLNNSITFKERRLKSFELIRGLFSFYLVCSLGAFANIAIASYVFGFSSNWLISSFVGAIFGAVWNFTLTSIFTWKSY
ncbi:glycosyltransferase family 2 protein [Paracoccaceae bacterium]|nr:glycosyltransferase family 2 protein [Paracoccaceae bacterium]